MDNRFKQLGQSMGFIRPDEQIEQRQLESDQFVDDIKQGEYMKALGKAFSPRPETNETQDQALLRESADLASFGMGTVNTTADKLSKILPKSLGNVIRTGDEALPSTSRWGGLRFLENTPVKTKNPPVAINQVKDKSIANLIIEQVNSNPGLAQKKEQLLKGHITPDQYQEAKQALTDATRTFLNNEQRLGKK